MKRRGSERPQSLLLLLVVQASQLALVKLQQAATKICTEEQQEAERTD